MSEPKYTIGIDLGTSNCAVAFAPLSNSAVKVSDFPVQQLLREGQVGEHTLLPSALYTPLEAERSVTSSTLPAFADADWIVGHFARWRGAKVPGRLITSAKSWLCHPGVDRTAGILPWGGAADVPRISPVQASSLLLQHLRIAWNQRNPGAPLEAQEVVVTVPASFDEVARSLTVNAARQAGFENFTLVEEPQAAFYHFSHRHQRDLAELLSRIRLVLIVDVGGGTTDFTLIQVAASAEGPLMKRIAVGEHLILGGDNMDNTIARRIEEKLKGRKLTSAQWIQAVQAAREAKEKLLGENPAADFRITIAGEGSQLLGSTLSAVLSREEVEALVLEGFFPATSADDLPKTARVTGIQEMGLPYVPEPAITRHLAAFLSRHSRPSFEALGLPADSRGLPRPDAILLNGGVFNSPRLAGKLVQAISGWWPDQPRIPTLDHDNLDLAVARGAAYYGLVRHGRGRRISGGTAHSFYLGVAPEKGEPTGSAICLIPRGMEEGETVELKERVFKLHVGRPVQFPIYTSTDDQVDRPGDIVRVTERFNMLPAIHTVLSSSKQRSERIPVFLRGKLTEIGTIELWCAAVDTAEQWRLEFEIRGSANASDSVTVTESLPPRFAEAKDYIAKIYGNRPSSIGKGPKDVKQLWSGLEQLLGGRETWSIALLRQLWGELFAGANKRRRSADHEKVFFQLLGYTLRPGFGYSLDEWRCEQAFKLFAESVEFHKEKPNWNEFWILWRRISGGLSSELQNTWWEYARPHLAVRVPLKTPRDLSRPKGMQPEGIEEMLRAAAAMEHLPSEEKKWLGDLICARLEEQRPAGGPWAWSLGRLGARAPLYGSAHNVIPPTQILPWIDLLIGLEKLDGSTFALAQLGRRTGDRARDLDEAARNRVISTLRARASAEPLIHSLEEPAAFKAADEARAFGDSLPIGLQLARHPTADHS